MADASQDQYRGTYFDGVTARRHEVVVERSHTGLVIRGETVGEREWPYLELRRAERVSPSEPIRYERGSLDAPEVLVVADPSFLPAMRGSQHQDDSMSRLRRRSIGSLILPALVALAALVSVWIWVLPALAARIATRVPVELEDRLGRSTVALFTEGAPVCTDPARVAALDAIVDELVADGRGGPYDYRVTIVDDSMVNAFAAPGGSIVVFQGLVAQAESPEEVAGVLAHEIQHVTNQHGLKALLRETPTQVALSVMIGSNPLGGSLAQAAYSLRSLSYQRSDEREADAGALRMLAAARVDPEGMLGFFRRGAEERGDLDGVGRWARYLSTHPGSAERLQALEALAAEQRVSPRPLLDAAQWAALKAPCDAARPGEPN